MCTLPKFSAVLGVCVCDFSVNAQEENVIKRKQWNDRATIATPQLHCQKRERQARATKYEELKRKKNPYTNVIQTNSKESHTHTHACICKWFKVRSSASAFAHHISKHTKHIKFFGKKNCSNVHSTMTIEFTSNISVMAPTTCFTTYPFRRLKSDKKGHSNSRFTMFPSCKFYMSRIDSFFLSLSLPLIRANMSANMFLFDVLYVS